MMEIQATKHNLISKYIDYLIKMYSEVYALIHAYMT